MDFDAAGPGVHREERLQGREGRRQNWISDETSRHSQLWRFVNACIPVAENKQERDKNSKIRLFGVVGGALLCNITPARGTQRLEEIGAKN